MSIDQWSQTPASNDLANYFQTGMAPSKVKNAGWDIMADLAQQILSLPTSAGTANAQTVTNTRQIGALFTGLQVWFLPGNANTGACTLAVDGLTAKNIFAYGAALLGGELQTNVPALVKYDGTQWNLINPNDATGSFTITLTGVSGTVTGTVNWRIVKGKTVYVWVASAILGTSNANTLGGTGIPSALAPSVPKRPNCMIEDNGAAVSGNIQTGALSTWTFGLQATTGFTSSGQKGLLSGTTFSYTLD